MSNKWSKYKNWTDWKTDPRRYCTIDGKWADISNYYWNLYNPGDKIIHGDGFVIHHKDEDHFNNSKDNLRKMTRIDHSVLHANNRSEEHNKKISKSLKGKMIGEKNPRFGKYIKLSEKTKEKISESLKGQIPVNRRYCMAEYQIFSSLSVAGKAFGISYQTIINRIKSNKPGYFYI